MVTQRLSTNAKKTKLISYYVHDRRFWTAGTEHYNSRENERYWLSVGVVLEHYNSRENERYWISVGVVLEHYFDRREAKNCIVLHMLY